MWWSWRGRIRRYFIGSLWVIPTLFGIAGAGLGWSAAEAAEFSDVSFAEYDVATATALLTAFIAAMVSFTGFVLTMVTFVVQFSTSQLSTRVLMFIYRDWRLKVLLGLFVCTMVFSFQLLSRMRANSIPNFQIVLAGLLVLFSILGFLAYLSHFAGVIRPASAASVVARYGATVVRERFPAPLDPARTAHQSPGPPQDAPIQSLVNSADGGVILAINETELVRIARQADGVVRLHYAVGDYVRHEATVMSIYADRPIAHRVRLDHLMAIGAERTFEQDPAYALRILVDIALKALSPAINDPTTAVQAIDRIDDLLELIARRELGVGELRDGGGSLRVIVPTRSWEDFLHLAIDEIRVYGLGDVQVMRRLSALLDDLLLTVPAPRRTAIVEQQSLLERAISRHFIGETERAFALQGDRQGIGHHRSGHGSDGHAILESTSS